MKKTGSSPAAVGQPKSGVSVPIHPRISPVLRAILAVSTPALPCVVISQNSPITLGQDLVAFLKTIFRRIESYFAATQSWRVTVKPFAGSLTAAQDRCR